MSIPLPGSTLSAPCGVRRARDAYRQLRRPPASGGLAPAERNDRQQATEWATPGACCPAPDECVAKAASELRTEYG